MFSLFLLAVAATLFGDTNQFQIFPWLADVSRALGGDSGILTVDPRDCEDIFRRDSAAGDGPHLVRPGGPESESMLVLCDMQGEGWTIVLKRFDGSVDFNKNWNEMKGLVGRLIGEFWLGLEDVHRLTMSGINTLMVEFGNGNNSWTELYRNFSLLGQPQKYTLSVSTPNRGYVAPDDPQLGGHNNNPFSTHDKDNSGYGRNCAGAWEGPGWFESWCLGYVLPFAPYKRQPRGRRQMSWRMSGRRIFLTKLILKIRR